MSMPNGIVLLGFPGAPNRWYVSRTTFSLSMGSVNDLVSHRSTSVMSSIRPLGGDLPPCLPPNAAYLPLVAANGAVVVIQHPWTAMRRACSRIPVLGLDTFDECILQRQTPLINWPSEAGREPTTSQSRPRRPVVQAGSWVSDCETYSGTLVVFRSSRPRC